MDEFQKTSPDVPDVPDAAPLPADGPQVEMTAEPTPSAPPPPERNDFEALASRVLALAQHGEHYTLDLIDAAVHRVHPEDVEAKAKRIAARVLSLVGADGWWHHANIDAAVTLAESQTGGTPK